MRKRLFAFERKVTGNETVLFSTTTRRRIRRALLISYSLRARIRSRAVISNGAKFSFFRTESIASLIWRMRPKMSYTMIPELIRLRSTSSVVKRL